MAKNKMVKKKMEKTDFRNGPKPKGPRGGVIWYTPEALKLLKKKATFYDPS